MYLRTSLGRLFFPGSVLFFALHHALVGKVGFTHHIDTAISGTHLGVRYTYCTVFGKIEVGK